MKLYDPGGNTADYVADQSVLTLEDKMFTSI
jgi:hypothetical protein